MTGTMNGVFLTVLFAALAVSLMTTVVPSAAFAPRLYPRQIARSELSRRYSSPFGWFDDIFGDKKKKAQEEAATRARAEAAAKHKAEEEAAAAKAAAEAKAAEEVAAKERAEAAAARIARAKAEAEEEFARFEAEEKAKAAREQAAAAAEEEARVAAEESAKKAAEEEETAKKAAEEEARAAAEASAKKAAEEEEAAKKTAEEEAAAKALAEEIRKIKQIEEETPQQKEEDAIGQAGDKSDFLSKSEGIKYAQEAFESNSRIQGVVQWYAGDKGYGFVKPYRTTAEGKELNQALRRDRWTKGGKIKKTTTTYDWGIFVHHSDIKAPDNSFLRKVYPLEFVEMDIAIDKKGRHIAKNVTGPDGTYVKKILHQQRDRK